MPDQAGLQATRFMLDRLKECTAEDLVLCAFSGGGSALSPAPRAPLELGEKQETTQLLLDCGATIFELNAIRKHLSVCKGGQLARIAYPATVVSLILSDVVGEPSMRSPPVPRFPIRALLPIVSGLWNDTGCRKSCLHRYSSCCSDGAQGLIEETPKPGDPVFQRVRNLVIGSNRAALLASPGRQKNSGTIP